MYFGVHPPSFFERKAEDRPVLGFVRDEALRELLHDDVEARLRVRGRVLREERRDVDLRVGGCKEHRLVFEVTVRRRSRDRCRLGGVLHGRRYSLGDERPRRSEQRVPRAQLLVRPAGFEVSHFFMVPRFFNGTMVP